MIESLFGAAVLAVGFALGAWFQHRKASYLPPLPDWPFVRDPKAPEDTESDPEKERYL